MSSVINYILLYAPRDERIVLILNEELAKLTAHPQFLTIAETEPSQRALETGIAFGALNYIYPGEVIDIINKLEWLAQDSVMLLSKDGNRDMFEEHGASLFIND